MTYVADVVLIIALYVILRPVNRNLALLAAFWRMLETAVLVVITLNSFAVLQVLSGAGYLRGFEPDRLQALAKLSIGAEDAGFNVGLMFLGLGSAVFSYLWFKSNYIPRVLAILGVVASLICAACTFSFIIFPEFQHIAEPSCFMPIFIFELAMGVWLLTMGLRKPAS
jgi:hypothetical protein